MAVDRRAIEADRARTSHSRRGADAHGRPRWQVSGVLPSGRKHREVQSQAAPLVSAAMLRSCTSHAMLACRAGGRTLDAHRPALPCGQAGKTGACLP